MHKRMEQVTVTVHEGQVIIRDETCDAYDIAVAVCPEQVDLLIEWLREAKAVALSQQEKMPCGSTAGRPDGGAL